MRFFLRAIILATLVGAMVYLYQLARASQAGDIPDGSTLIACYAGIVLVGAGLAAMFSTWFLPAIGDLVGGFLYSPEAPERHPHASAMAKVAAGDYAGAVEQYRIRLQDHPEDILAVHEVVHLYCDKLHDPASAAGFLQEMLEFGNWNDYQRGLLFQRLQEIRSTRPEESHPAPQLSPDEFLDGGL